MDVIKQLELMMNIADVKRRYAEQTPHKYISSNPYKGCNECGFGPGAAFHFHD